MSDAPGSLAVYVAAGSNIEPLRHLRQALDLLRARFPGLVASRAYANAAVGFDGQDFVNLVVGFRTELSLATLLEQLHVVETACGRPRDARARGSPRAGRARRPARPPRARPPSQAR